MTQTIEQRVKAICPSQPTGHEIDQALGDIPRLKVALSGYHSGQIVSPTITAGRYGRNENGAEIVRVILVWADASDQTYNKPEGFEGSRVDCENWLMSHGVHLDAQGIY